MSQNSTLEDDETDVIELLAGLWSHKLLITLFTGLSIFLAGYYIITSEKKFTAKSVFQIQQTNNSDFSIPGELSALATLASFAGAKGNTDANILLERAKIVSLLSI